MAYDKYKGLTERIQSDKVLQAKLLKFQAMQNIMDIKEDWLQWFLSFLIKNQKAVVLNLCQINFINELLENLKCLFSL